MPMDALGNAISAIDFTKVKKDDLVDYIQSGDERIKWLEYKINNNNKQWTDEEIAFFKKDLDFMRQLMAAENQKFIDIYGEPALP